MKPEESRELRNLSMNQLNAKLSELYKELPRRNPQVFIRKTLQESSTKANQPNQIRTNPEKKGIKVTRSIHNP